MKQIEEKDLVALHDRLEKSNQELQQIEDNFYKERDKTDNLKNQLKISIGIAAVLLLFLLSSIVTYFVKPDTFIQESYLAENGWKQANDVSADYMETEVPSLQDKMIYAVQVGAFEERMVSMYSESFVNLKEIQEDEFYKYSLGNFETLTEAQRFRKELLKIGFRDAFIASYENGERLKIEEAW